MTSIDPRAIEYPWQSPYAYHRNSPIWKVDFLGGGDPFVNLGYKDYESPFFMARLIKTTAYDAYFAVFNTASRILALDYRATYAKGKNDEEIFEVSYYKTYEVSLFEELTGAVLDVLGSISLNTFDPSDFIFSKTSVSFLVV